MPDGRHWLKRDVLIPAGVLLLSTAALVWLTVRLLPLFNRRAHPWLLLLYAACLLVFAVFASVTVRHILTSYTLEQFDPGDPASVRKLARMARFAGPRSDLDPGQYAAYLESYLRSQGFAAEMEHKTLGKILVRIRRRLRPSTRWTQRERVFLVEKPLNVFVVDFTIRDAQRFLTAQPARPSDRNLLVFVNQEAKTLEAASAAAGVVNFLYRTEESPLGILMFDCPGRRLYYPIDQTQLPGSCRRYSRRMRRELARAVQKED
jgi:hypothetical protein